AAQINLANIKALNNPNHPLLKPAEAEVAATRAKLAQTQGRLSGKGVTQAQQLRGYETLKAAQDFADSNLTTARQEYANARADALRLQRYLSVIAEPVPNDRPNSPDLPMLLLEGLAGGLVLAFVRSMAVGLVRSVTAG